MTLKDILKKATIEDLKKIDILKLNIYAEPNHDALTFLYNNEIIDDPSIETVLEEKVLEQARKDYRTMTREGRSRTLWADRLEKPEYLAYALEKCKFSGEEIEEIPFDHGENAKIFPQIYGKKGLLPILRKELLNPKPFNFKKYLKIP